MTPFPSVPSAKRKAEIKALWPSGYGFPSTLDRPSFWGLIAGLEAQSRADGDRRVEAMKRATIERLARIAEEETEVYHEGMSAVDVRLSSSRKSTYRDGPKLAARFRALSTKGGA